MVTILQIRTCCWGALCSFVDRILCASIRRGRNDGPRYDRSALTSPFGACRCRRLWARQYFRTR